MRADAIRELLRRTKIATMPELKAALGTAADMTVFRRLRELGYRTSYSDRGKYYTLDEIADFDATGLWSHDGVRFSKHGTLLNTCEALVGESEAGYFASELEPVLHVSVKDALRKLANEGRIVRQDVGGRLLHLSADARVRRRQLAARTAGIPDPSAGGGAASDEVKAAIVLFFALLDEKQRRLYAGLESLKLGNGGDQRIAGLLGLDPATVSRGRQELISQDFEKDRVRKPGGGRKPLEKKRRK
jgi:hypothetical protein